MALYHERLYPIQKLRLRLYDDHCDLSELRRVLAKWMAGEEEFSTDKEGARDEDVKFKSFRSWHRSIRQ
jgi:hypothetical protein